MPRITPQYSFCWYKIDQSFQQLRFTNNFLPMAIGIAYRACGLLLTSMKFSISKCSPWRQFSKWSVTGWKTWNEKFVDTDKIHDSRKKQNRVVDPKFRIITHDDHPHNKHASAHRLIYIRTHVTGIYSIHEYRRYIKSKMTNELEKDINNCNLLEKIWR